MNATWTLVGFTERFDEWMSFENPPSRTRRAVLLHVMNRADAPYTDVRREPGFDNLWFGEVPRTRHGWTFVLCSSWIDEADHTVRCDRLATLDGSV